MDVDDYWNDESFEDAVARALIACYETRFKKNRGAHPSDRLTAADMERTRRVGPYLPAPSRVVHVPDHTSLRGWFDTHNDPLPTGGCVAMGGVKEADNCYLHIGRFYQVARLPKHWKRAGGGALFGVDNWFCSPDALSGERAYFTVTKEGVVESCVDHAQKAYSPGHPAEMFTSPEEELRDWAQRNAIYLQFEADRRFCWSVTAQESTPARATLGCMKEEIKSLLYARSLPLTATGRKRPILHLVAAHHRRMKNGTDVDIDQFLRGTRVIEMGGTQFTVNPPAVLVRELSRAKEKEDGNT